MKETWKLWKPGYSWESGNGKITVSEPIYISDLGNVKGRKTRVDRYVKFQYKGKSYSLHNLVAELFIPYTGLNPDGTPIIGKPVVNHKDEDKTHNWVDNLEWCDSTYNNKYGTRIKRSSESVKNNPNRKNIKKVRCVETNEIFISARAASDKYKLFPRAVSQAANPKHTRNKTAGGYHWEYI